MRTIGIWIGIAALAIGAGVALSDSPPPAPTPPARVGKLETAHWTETTIEAAASEANKKVLKSGKAVSITGEVIDVSCYLQLGKRGDAHVACGTKCLNNGQPIGLLDKQDDIHILFPEEHHPRRDGEVDLKSVFIPLLAKTVTVTGMETQMKGYKALFVQAAEAQKETSTGTTEQKK